MWFGGEERGEAAAAAPNGTKNGKEDETDDATLPRGEEAMDRESLGGRGVCPEARTPIDIYVYIYIL